MERVALLSRNVVVRKAPEWMTGLRGMVLRGRERSSGEDRTWVACSVVMGDVVIKGVSHGLYEVMNPIVAGGKLKMLHGCAEHNAIAAAAAQGHDLSTIDHIALYAEHSERFHPTSPIPCSSCTNLLLTLARSLPNTTQPISLNLLTPCPFTPHGCIVTSPVPIEAAKRLAHPLLDIRAWRMGV
eukprot:TRINITY_DN12044_c0_g1_i1.p1 TRINITY_DN12044_c0_g1~~TRINITY_DN12044_c0_g1_i1.p1  ORF type:complete len:184 (+),score=22.68 TRINITY_DN12044_c0_g1_i1:518-1069(+)